MAPSRLIAPALRFTPVALLVTLEAWVAWDLASVHDPRWSVPLSLLFVANLVFFAMGRTARRRWARWTGLVALGGTYVVTHAFVLGVSLVAAIVFVSGLIAQLEVRILVERFAPVFTETLTRAQRKQIRTALLRAVIRLTIASILSVFLPLLAADLAIAGVFPVTTIPTALVLSAGLVTVVLLIAVLPTLEPRMAKDN